MKNMWKSVKKDLWVILLDIIAVNLSYFLALIIRFYVNFALRPIALKRYMPAWIGFTPWYTVICIVIFIIFKLYGGLWRYAGINDMNRIIGATLVTSLIHFTGTRVFFTRMPISYYIIGTVLQFTFLVLIRFSFRIIKMEKRRLLSIRSVKEKCLLVGSGESGRMVLKHLEVGDAFRPVAIYDPKSSGTMDGVPIVSELNLDGIQTVVVANPLLTATERAMIQQECKKNRVDLQDYTGIFSNLGGNLSVTELLSVMSGPLSIEINGESKAFSSGEAALASLTKRYTVEELTGNITVHLEEPKKQSNHDMLVQAYAAVMGEDITSSEMGAKQ